MKLDPKLLVSTLENIPEIIETYVSNIPKERLDVKRNAEAWTIREHVYHVASVQKMLYKRIELIRTEKNPVITPFFPEKQVAIGEFYDSPEAAFEEYRAERKRQVALIASLCDADFQNEATHGEYVRYNIPIILNHMVFHEYWHMYRIEELWLTKDEYFK